MLKILPPVSKGEQIIMAECPCWTATAGDHDYFDASRLPLGVWLATEKHKMPY